MDALSHLLAGAAGNERQLSTNRARVKARPHNSHTRGALLSGEIRWERI